MSSPISSKRWQELQTTICDTKSTIMHINVDLLREIERREHTEHTADYEDSCGRYEWKKIVDTISTLNIECEKFKLNIQKLSDSYKGDKHTSTLGRNEVRPIQEEGETEKFVESDDVIKRGKQAASHRYPDSGIGLDESRPGSAASGRSVSTSSEPRESEDMSRFSMNTRALLEVSGETASSRRPEKTPKRGSTL